MPLAPHEIERIATLARLALTDDERQRLAPQLERILEYVESLRALETTDVAPTTHTLAPEGALRDDEPQPSLPRTRALANAPHASLETGLFSVPRVIGG